METDRVCEIASVSVAAPCDAFCGALKPFSQETVGLLEIICIEGGMVTQVEAKEMGSIIRRQRQTRG